jgi:hypothetical protein
MRCLTTMPTVRKHPFANPRHGGARASARGSLAPFECNGRIEITLYVSANLYYDYSCI